MGSNKQYGRPRPPKFIGIKVQYGKLEGELDHIVLWNGNIPRCDRVLVLTHLSSKIMRFNYDSRRPYFEDSFLEELDKRGYDIKTIKFSIEKNMAQRNNNEC